MSTIPRKRLKLEETGGYQGANSTPLNNPFLAQPVRYHIYKDLSDDMDAIQNSLEETNFYIDEVKNIPYEYEVYQLITEGTTGKVAISEGAKILLDKYPNAGDCLIVKVDPGSLYPIDEAAEDALGNVVVSTLNLAGDYELDRIPSAYPVAIVYRIETTWEYLRYISFANVVGELRVQLASSVKVDTSGFTTNLAVTDDNLQKVSNKVDALNLNYTQGNGITINAVNRTITNSDRGSVVVATHENTYDHTSFITLGDVPSQVNADWNAIAGVEEILNKPDLSNLAIIDDTGDGSKFLADDGAYKEVVTDINFSDEFVGGGSVESPYSVNAIAIDKITGLREELDRTLYEIELTETVASITITEDKDGNPLNIEGDFAIVMNIPAIVDSADNLQNNRVGIRLNDVSDSVYRWATSGNSPILATLTSDRNNYRGSTLLFRVGSEYVGFSEGHYTTGKDTTQFFTEGLGADGVQKIFITPTFENIRFIKAGAIIKVIKL